MDLEESEADPEEEFMKEARAIFEDSQASQQVQQLPDGKFIKNLSSEIRSCKLTFNVSNSIVLETLVPLILKTVSTEDESPKAIAKEIHRTLTLNSGLIREFCREDKEMSDLIEEVELFCGKNPDDLKVKKFFHIIL